MENDGTIPACYFPGASILSAPGIPNSSAYIPRTTIFTAFAGTALWKESGNRH